MSLAAVCPLSLVLAREKYNLPYNCYYKMYNKVILLDTLLVATVGKEKLLAQRMALGQTDDLQQEKARKGLATYLPKNMSFIKFIKET